VWNLKGHWSKGLDGVLQEDALVQDFLRRADTNEVQNLEIISGRYGTDLNINMGDADTETPSGGV